MHAMTRFNHDDDDQSCDWSHVPHGDRVAIARVAHALLTEPIDNSSAEQRVRRVSEWALANAEPLRLFACGGLDPDAVETLRSPHVAGTLPSLTRAISDAIVRANQVSTSEASLIARRVGSLGKSLSLSPTDVSLLLLLTRASSFEPMQTLTEACIGRGREQGQVATSALARMLGLREHVVRARLAHDAPLAVLHLVDRGRQYCAVSGVMRRVARAPRCGSVGLANLLQGVGRKSVLGWDDFAHLGPARDIARAVLTAGLQRGEVGLNILLHGEPGTGKTEFATVLGEVCSVPVRFVGEADDYGGEPTRGERVGAFTLAAALAGRAGQTVVAVDEADDLLCGVDSANRASREGSKLFMNRMIERAAAPTIWIVNDPERLGESVVRRMTLAIQFRRPPLRVRQTMVRRMSAGQKIRLTNASVDRLAALEAAPALLAAGFRAGRLARGGVDAIAGTITGLMVALGSPSPVPKPDRLRFDPALSRADTDLAVLADRAVAAATGPLSFLLSGPSGSGKSAYARYLAQSLGLEVYERRASDLLDPYVGMTERRISEAFAAASDSGSILIIDEIDSLLRDRATVQRGWEATMVNEMLIGMERHSWPFAFTTNAPDVLDPAVQRRFLFKVKFLEMDEDRARRAFEQTFGILPPKSLDRVSPLVPADFNLVARQLVVLGNCAPERIVEMLAAEVACKTVAGREIGFAIAYANPVEGTQ